MADPNIKLRQALEELHGQLNELRKRDPATAAKLEATVAAATSALAETDRPPDERESIAKRLSDAVREYEATHPSLAGNLGSVIDALGQMGI